MVSGRWSVFTKDLVRCLRSAERAFPFVFALAASPIALGEIVQIIQHRVGTTAVIGITQDGKPVVAANVFVDQFRGQVKSTPHIATSVTDSKGEVSMSGLPEGLFSISVVVRGEKHWLGNLEVSSDVDVAQSRALYDIFPKFDALPGCIHKPLDAHLQSLQGTVTDTTGAVIASNCDIEVFADRSQNAQPLLRLKTDKAGKFAAKLTAGDYVVAFNARGFRYQKISVTIDPNGWRGIQVALPVSVSDCGAKPDNDSKIAEEK